MTIKEQSDTRRQQVSDYRASGQTAEAWCAQNNLKVSTLRYWLNKCKREAKADLQQETFVEFKPSSAKEIPIILKVGVISIELYPGFQAETLREIITAIRSI